MSDPFYFRLLSSCLQESVFECYDVSSNNEFAVIKTELEGGKCSQTTQLIRKDVVF